MVTSTQFTSKNASWTRYTPESVVADFQEYKHKENTKWHQRAKKIGARFPIFDDLEQFKTALNKAQIVSIDRIGYVDNLTKNSSIADIESMVSSYIMPRDVQRIVHGLESGATLPLPIIIKGATGQWIMAGNTRQATARVLGYIPMALLVDVSK